MSKFSVAEDGEIVSQNRERQLFKLKTIVAGAIGLFLVITSIPAMTAWHLLPMWLHNSWLQLVLSTPVLFWCGSSFFVGAIKSWQHRTANMDTLGLLKANPPSRIMSPLTESPTITNLITQFRTRNSNVNGR